MRWDCGSRSIMSDPSNRSLRLTSSPRRAHKLKARSEVFILDLAGLRRSKEMPASMLRQSHLDAYRTAPRARLQSGEGVFP